MELSTSDAENMAEVMQALSSAGRLRILARLEDGPASVSELVAATGIAQATLSNHLRLMRHLSLVSSTRDGRQVIYQLADHHVQEFLAQAIKHVVHE